MEEEERKKKKEICKIAIRLVLVFTQDKYKSQCRLMHLLIYMDIMHTKKVGRQNSKVSFRMKVRPGTPLCVFSVLPNHVQYSHSVV